MRWAVLALRRSRLDLRLPNLLPAIVHRADTHSNAPAGPAGHADPHAVPHDAHHIAAHVRMYWMIGAALSCPHVRHRAPVHTSTLARMLGTYRRHARATFKVGLVAAIFMHLERAEAHDLALPLFHPFSSRRSVPA
jgi:hypothetical protein